MATQVTTLKERSMLAMPECKIFDHGVCVGPTGAVRPCCAFMTAGIPNMRWEENWRPRHDAWREESKTKWLDQCIECKQDEEINGDSLRMYYNEELKYAEGIKYWDLKINNTCNLACRMCDPTSSSIWQQIATADTDKQLASHYHNKVTGKWHKEAKDFLYRMVDATHVKFTGGEPFLIPQVKKIIEGLIDMDVAGAVNLQLITNGTHNISQWNHLFAKFKRVNISISLDAIGKRYEYIRPGASWEQVSTNVLEWNASKGKNSNIWITALPMILNKDHLWEVEEWCSTNKLDFGAASPCINPAFLRTTAWEDPKLRVKFIQQMEILDKLHNTNWRDFINE